MKSFLGGREGSGEKEGKEKKRRKIERDRETEEKRQKKSCLPLQKGSRKEIGSGQSLSVNHTC